MKKRDTVCIGDIYGKMLNPLRHSLRESKNVNAFGNQPELKGKGPHTDGYNKALNDEKESCDEDEEDSKLSKRQKTVQILDNKLKDTKLSDKQKEKIKKQRDSMTAEEAEEELFVKENRKNIISMVNNSMSKSVFDKLYSKVLKENFGQEDNDIDALGLDDSTSDSDMGGEFGDDEFGDDEGEGDTVTFTLDRATAQTLIDVLQGAIGEGESEDDFGDEGDDLDFGDEGGEDDFGGDYEEDEESQGTKPAVDKKKAFQGKGNKVSGPPSPKSGKAKTDVTDETGTKDGAPNFSALQGKNNQVPGSTLKKATDYFK